MPARSAPAAYATKPPASAFAILCAAAALFLATALATPATAATFTVDTTGDDVAKSACDDIAADDCSLRGAVAHANGDAAPDTIVVPAGTYTLSVASPCFFAAAAGDSVGGTPVVAICLNSNLDIVGASLNETIIQSNGADRIFAVSNTKTVTISGVTLSGGRNGFGFQIGGGGAINNHGTLTLSDSLVTNNQLVNQSGGGLHNFGTLAVIRSTITGNSTSSGSGGGISNTCCPGNFVVPVITLTVIDSTISNNGAQNGGGIATTRIANVIGSTIDGNIATSGGGIYHGGDQLAVLNSTISGNTGLGGGIGPIGNLLRLESSTITKNHGIPYGGGFYSSNNR
ncbi:MAG: hypothetical protein ABIR79_12450, partial [Candidatus Binatia bacterium]